MKHLVIGIFILASLTAAQNVRVEKLLNQAKQYYEVSENIEELQKFVEDIVADPLKGAEQILDELEETGDSIIQSIQFAQVSRNTANSTYVNNTNSTTNYTYPNNTYYNYSTTGGYTQPSTYNNTNYTLSTNYTNNTYPSNYTYSNYSYPAATYSYTYDNTTNQNISSSNDTYSNSTYQNYTDTNSTYSNYTDTNSTYSNYTDTNSTYQNYTNYNNTMKDRIQQKIHLKLRKQLNLSGVHNYTQNITYYNPYRQQYEYIVLFNETNTVTKSRPNEYYFYQNNTLITLQREYDYYGNIVYRNATLDQSFVVQQQQDGYSYNSNTNVYGTLVVGNGNWNGTYYKNGYAYTNYQNGQGMTQYGNDQQFSNYTVHYSNGSAYINGNKNNNGYNSLYNNNYTYNGTVGLQNSQVDTQSYNNQKQINGNYDRDYNYSSLYTNSSNSNYDSSVNSSQIYDEDYTMQVDQISSNSQSGSNYKNSYAYGDQKQSYESQDYSSSSSNSEIDTLYYDTFTIGNSTNFYSDYQSSSSNNSYGTGNYQTNSSSNNEQIKSGYGNSQFANNQTYSFNASDSYANQVTKQSSQYSQFYPYLDQPYQQNTNQVQESYNYTSEYTEKDGINQKTNATLDGHQYNYTSSQYGDEAPQTDSHASNTHISYNETTVQQFNQLRGSKKATGSWKQVDVQELQSSNSQIVEQAIKQVNEQYQPNKEGFEFNSVINVNEQIVAGINYAINLQFINAEGNSRIYQVIIYSAPWTNKPDQVISCQRVFEQDQ